jgi:lysophospholipase L1-like esterase
VSALFDRPAPPLIRAPVGWAARAAPLGDGTHFQVNGARIMAGIVADGVRELALPLAAYEK